jgi:hypothetical protein
MSWENLCEFLPEAAERKKGYERAAERQLNRQAKKRAGLVVMLKIDKEKNRSS